LTYLKEELTASITSSMSLVSRDRWSKLLWNVSQHPPDYKAQHSRRQPSYKFGSSW